MKQSTLTAYSKEIGGGLVDVGRVMDDVQNVKIQASLSEAKNAIKLKEIELRNKYESNPDDPGFKNELDTYISSVYDTHRANINPIYRGAFNKKSRELTKLINFGNEEWKFKQTGVNLENNMKRIADGLMADAYDAGSNGDYVTAESVFDQNMSTLLPVANKFLGSEKTKNALDKMKKSYLTQFAMGMIDDNPRAAAALLDDKAFAQKIGGEKLTALKRSLKKAQKAEQRQARREAIRQARENATEARRLLSEANRQKKARLAAEKEKKAAEKAAEKEQKAAEKAERQSEKAAVKEALAFEKQEQEYRDKLEKETGGKLKYNFETGQYELTYNEADKASDKLNQLTNEREIKEALRREEIGEEAYAEEKRQEALTDEELSVERAQKALQDVDTDSERDVQEDILRENMGEEAYQKYLAEIAREEAEAAEWDELINAAPEETEDDAKNIAKDAISMLENQEYDFETDEGQEEFERATLEAIVAVHNNSAENGGYLTEEQRDEYLNQIQEFYNDNYIDGRVKKLYDEMLDENNSTWLDRWLRKSFRNKIETAREKTNNRQRRQLGIQLNTPGGTSLIGIDRIIPPTKGLSDKNISEIAMKAYNNIYQAARIGDREAARQAFKTADRELLNLRYPELQGKEIGDVIITADGIPAKLVGMDSDNYYAERIK